MKLQQRRILITGGGSGIGLEVASLLAPDNHVMVASRDKSKLSRVAEMVAGLQTTVLDVTSEASARRAIDAAVERLGGLDLLINGAGVLRSGSFELDPAGRQAAEQVAVNLGGSLRMTRLALPHLRRAKGGALVFISSALALAAAPRLAGYAASKAAIRSAARSLRSELDGLVAVFEVVPPFVETELASDFSVPKLSAHAVATEILYGLRRDRHEIRIGRVRALAVIGRLLPWMADRIIARELGGSSGSPPVD